MRLTRKHAAPFDCEETQGSTTLHIVLWHMPNLYGKYKMYLHETMKMSAYPLNLVSVDLPAQANVPRRTA